MVSIGGDGFCGFSRWDPAAKSMNRLPTSSAVRLLVRENSQELLKKAKEEPLKKPITIKADNLHFVSGLVIRGEVLSEARG